MKYNSGDKLTLNRQEPEVAQLLELSSRVGQNPMLVQACSGNTSIKLGDVLWIKASGKWLASANREEILVPVELARAREAVRSGADISGIGAEGSNLRPSIETAMHVMLPHRVVVHLHSINTIAWAIRKDAPDHLAERLAGLNWKWIQYVPSGVPLARQIEKSLCYSPDTDVFILANHGLVVCGDDCSAVEALLWDIERRLATTPRRPPHSEAALSAVVARSSEWRLPILPELHALGTDPVSRRILQGGILFPCQAIFFGHKVRMLPCSVPLSRFADYSNGRNGDRTFVIVAGGGVVIHKQISSAQQAILVGLMQVIQRTDEFAPLRYLTTAELTELSAEGPHPYLTAMESANEAREAIGPY